ncbi:O-antigen translocase [Hwanghaeella grinnelliae]|uniref:O-antigen translocase n=2 Tax=Hwanghaeella grinnelliae TaxID=2500179 RepID=A0A3S2VMV5_9PROT|nr:O-antigen translocase [Hwanghaeella grinnelliae]
MAIIASAQALRIIITVARAKIVALLLGPAGIGLLSLLTNLREIAGMAAGLGMSGSGVRELAGAKDSPEGQSRVRRVLLGALFTQGAIAMLVIWFLREQLAVWILDDAKHATDVGLVGVGVLLFLLATSQTTLFQGLRRIGDLGKVTVWSTLIGTAGGLLAVIMADQAGLVWLILLPPVFSILFGFVYIRRLPKPVPVQMSLRDIWRVWLPMTRLGVVFMVGSFAMFGTLLLVRSKITQDMSLEDAGYFAAAWSVGTVYIGFLLQAMGADYFPRLTEIVREREKAVQLMNDQLQLALALGGPLILSLIGCAPWLISLLYSSEFGEAVTILQWQMFGNVLKLATWSLGFVFIAAGQPRVSLTTTLIFNAIFLLLVWYGLSEFGLKVTGIAFVIAQTVDFFVVTLLARKLHRFKWQKLTLVLFCLHAALAGGLLVFAPEFPLIGGILSLVLGFATGFVGVHIVLEKIGSHGRLVTKVATIYRKLGWPVD